RRSAGAARRVDLPRRGRGGQEDRDRSAAGADRSQRVVIVDVVTIFPAMIDAALLDGVVGRARTRGVVDIRAWDLREFTDDRHRTVADVPYGGGAGMVMRPEPIVRAVEAIAERRGTPAAVLLMSPQGRRFTHADAERLSRIERLVVICGRYEGVDQRVTDELG